MVMRRLVPVLVAAMTAGCARDESPAPLACTAAQELFRGKCVDPATRYEPDQRVDSDNVVAYGDPLKQLMLPDPPKSGFRIIAPPKKLVSGEEDELCLSWPYPAIHDKIVYAGRVYTTPGLHHSNLIAKDVNPMYGKNPYPGCNPGASDPFDRITDGVIPDVLFANTTQILGGETLAFPPGIGFRIDTSREMATDMHLLNTSGADETVEVAYDFFTMPESDLENEVAPWTMQVDSFDVPPHTTQTVGTSCYVFGGEVVEMMPHTHKHRTEFSVDFLEGANETPKRIEMYGAPDQQSEIRVFSPSLSLDQVSKIDFGCKFQNDSNKDLVYGLGDNEMCVLFGYVYPVKMQFVAHAPAPDQDCQSIQIGLFR